MEAALAALVDIGVPLLTALSIAGQHNPRYDGLVDLYVETGKLSSAMARRPHLFDPTWITAVEVGETGGTLDVRLRDLVHYEHFVRNAGVERRVVGSLWVLSRADVLLSDLVRAALLSAGSPAEVAQGAYESVAEGGNPIEELAARGCLAPLDVDLLRQALRASKLGEMLDWLVFGYRCCCGHRFG